jgi:hypothetical protein
MPKAPSSDAAKWTDARAACAAFDSIPSHATAWRMDKEKPLREGCHV